MPGSLDHQFYQPDAAHLRCGTPAQLDQNCRIMPPVRCGLRNGWESPLKRLRDTKYQEVSPAPMPAQDIQKV